jgi:hypothetical protein
VALSWSGLFGWQDTGLWIVIEVGPAGFAGLALSLIPARRVAAFRGGAPVASGLWLGCEHVLEELGQVGDDAVGAQADELAPLAAAVLAPPGLTVASPDADTTPIFPVRQDESPIAVLTAEIALLHARLDDLQSRMGK